MGVGSAAFAVLPLLISGYLFNLVFYPLRYFSSRAEGQKLFFMAAGSGVVMGCFVFLATGLLKRTSFVRDSFIFDAATAINASIPVPHASRLLFLMAFSVVAALFLNGLCGIYFRKRPSAVKAVYEKLIEKFGNSMAQLFRKAADEQKTVMLTLSSRKIYCGRILEIPSSIDSDNACVELLPAFSAYRDKDTLRMGQEKTNYPVIALWEARRYLESREKMKEKLQGNLPPAIDFLGKNRAGLLEWLEKEIAEAKAAVEKFDAAHVDIQDWVKVIPVKEIESASFYDAKAYALWFSAPDKIVAAENEKINAF